MFYRYMLLLSAFAVSNAALSQQSQGLELNLEQFPAESTPENRSTEGNDQLQLDLKQFETQDDSKSLELNIEKFDESQSDQVADTNTRINSDNTELNLEQFEKEDNPSLSRESGQVSQGQAGSDIGNGGVGKINNSGSAASKVGDADGTLSSDDRYLIKAGLWFLAVAIPVFLLVRARIRKRRRSNTRPRTRPNVTYNEVDHR